jgi:hypothetical protein
VFHHWPELSPPILRQKAVLLPKVGPGGVYGETPLARLASGGDISGQKKRRDQPMVAR